MNFIDDFEKREWLGRQALKEIKVLYPNYFKYELHFTTGKYDKYDFYYLIIDEQFRIVKRVLGEIKIRDRYFDEYILEEKKYNSLMKVRKEMGMNKDEMSLLYINLCVDGTYVYDLDKLELKWDTLMANKATCDSRTNKVKKSVLYLTKSSGKFIPYVINEKKLLAESIIEEKIEKVKKEISKGLNFMWDN
jgi:hypothetical protein